MSQLSGEVEEIRKTINKCLLAMVIQGIAFFILSILLDRCRVNSYMGKDNKGVANYQASLMPNQDVQ